MTGAEFRAKYQLQKALTAQGVRSHLAVQPDGRAVMVHFVEGKSPREKSDLLGRIDHLPPAQRTRILEIVQVDDTPTVVTEYLQGFETLEEWLGLPSPSPAEQQPETAPAPRDADGPGELTALFGALPDTPDQPPAVEEQGQAPPAATGSAPPEPSPPPADSREEAPPGEFTQLFTPVGDAKPTLVDQPGRTQDDPGQSTQVDGVEGGSQPPPALADKGPPRPRDTTPEAGAASAPPTPKKPPGELTRLFGVHTDDGVGTDGDDKEQARPAAGTQHPQREEPADAPHPAGRSKPRVFWKKRPRPGPPLPPLVEQARRPPPKPAPPSDLARRPQAPELRPQKQPGQFTKLFGGDPESPPTKPPQPAAPQPPPEYSFGQGQRDDSAKPGGPSRDSGDYRRALERWDADVGATTPPVAGGAAPIQPPATPAPAPYPAPPAAGGPSEFTKVMGGVQVPLPPADARPAQPPPPPAAAPAKRHTKGLIIGFSLVFAVLFIVVILLAVLL